MEPKNKKGKTIALVLFVIISVLLGAYLAYEKFYNEPNKVEKYNNKYDKLSSKNNKLTQENKTLGEENKTLQEKITTQTKEESLSLKTTGCNAFTNYLATFKAIEELSDYKVTSCKLASEDIDLKDAKSTKNKIIIASEYNVKVTGSVSKSRFNSGSEKKYNGKWINNNYEFCEIEKENNVYVVTSCYSSL